MPRRASWSARSVAPRMLGLRSGAPTIATTKAPQSEVADAVAEEPIELPVTDTADEYTRAFPQKLDDLDVGSGFLADLTLKVASLDADCTTTRVAERLRL